jgi:hypothetical protein
MIINLLIPDKLKIMYNSFDDCLVDGYYNLKLINFQTLQEDNVRIPKNIVIKCDLSKNLMQIDDENLKFLEVEK